MKLLRLPEVIARTGLGRSSIYAFMKAGTFPRPVLLGAKSVAWEEAKIHAWILQRIKEAEEGYQTVAE